jgi:hypothetical protein
MAYCSEIRTKHTNEPCEQNVEVLVRLQNCEKRLLAPSCLPEESMGKSKIQSSWLAGCDWRQHLQNSKVHAIHSNKLWQTPRWASGLEDLRFSQPCWWSSNVLEFYVMPTGRCLEFHMKRWHYLTSSRDYYFRKSNSSICQISILSAHENSLLNNLYRHHNHNYIFRQYFLLSNTRCVWII